MWTKSKVQEHAQKAAAVELYTIPFYTTVMTSIRDTQSEAYKIIRGVLIEEMMHLEQAANLCVALDTPPNLELLPYGIDVPYLKPGRVLRVKMGALNASTLDAMLAIETPEGILGSSDHTPNPNYSPKYPYSSIEEMYKALLHGIEDVGIDQFSWNSSKQNDHWTEQGYRQIIRSYEDAKNAVNAIKDQGEGIVTGNGANPWNFPIGDPNNQLINSPPPGVISHPYDPAVLYKEYSHYGRFLKIKNSPLPDVYAGQEAPEHPANKALQNNFSTILDTLNYIWQTGEVTFPIPMPGGLSVNPMWMVALSAMKQTTQLALNCWKAGVIPYWREAE